MIREHAIISKTVPKDIVGLSVALDAVAILPIESLEAKVVVVMGGPPVEGLSDDDPELAHLELDLLANICHDLSNRL